MSKYSPQIGEDILAEDYQSIQPVSGVAGYLTGGNNPSNYSVFETLRLSGNIGKVKASIHGTVIDNINVISEYVFKNFIYSSNNIATTYTSNQFAINPTGTKIFYSRTLVSQNAYVVYSRTLNTPWDLSTAGVETGIFPVNGTRYVGGMAFSPDGTKFYLSYHDGSSSRHIEGYALSTPWDLSTAVSSYNFDSSSSDQTGNLWFSTDGTKLYWNWRTITDGSTWKVREYTLSTPWNVSTASLVSQSFPSSNIWWYDNGNKLLVSDGTKLKIYNASTAWSLTTATDSLDYIDVSAGGGGIFLANGSRLYTGGGTFYQYNNGEIISSMGNVASLLQTALAGSVGENLSVVYDVNHFKITSGRVGNLSKVLKLMTPSTGEDMSGNGVTKYYDLGINATETLGVGLNPQNAGKLTSGSNVSSLEIFKALSYTGGGQGKYKANIDGVITDNIPLIFSVDDNNSLKIKTLSSNTGFLYIGSVYYGQTVTLNGLKTISQVSVPTNGTSADHWLEIKTAVGGTTIASMNAGYNNDLVFNFPTPVDVSAYETLFFQFQDGSVGVHPYINNTNQYSGGGFYKSGAPVENTDMDLSITGKGAKNSSFSDIALALQNGIRSVTGKTEGFSYSNGRFVLKSSSPGNQSKVLKLMSPTTGVDISGAGATPYLDMASNGNEFIGVGEEDKLVRLDETGNIYGSKVFVKSGTYILTTTMATVLYPTKVLDKDNEFNLSTGIFTASIGGYYLITAGTGQQHSGFNTAILKVVKNINGTPEILIGATACSGSPAGSASCSGVFFLNAGDTICVQMRQQTWAGEVIDTGEGTFPYFSITKV